MKKTARRRKHNFKKTFILLILGSVCVTVLGGGFAIKLLFYDLAFAFSPTSYDLTKEDYAVISEIEVSGIDTSKPIQISSLSVVVYDTKGKKITKYTLPMALKVDMAGKFGEEELSKLLAVALLQDKDLKIAANTVNKTLEKLIGFHVDRYVFIDTHQDVTRSIDGLLFLGKTLELTNLKQILLSVKTDMSVNEFYDLVSFSSSLPQDRIKQQLIDLNDVIDVTKLFDTNFRDLTFDSNVAYEAKNIAVLNGTNVFGVASHGARRVENIGGHVFSSENASRTYDTSVIIADNRESESVKQISKLFGIKNVVSKEEISNIQPQINEAVVDRADIVVILGFDFAQFVL